MRDTANDMSIATTTGIQKPAVDDWTDVPALLTVVLVSGEYKGGERIPCR